MFDSQHFHGLTESFSLPVVIAVCVYFCVGFIVAGARTHFSPDIQFLFALVFPIHSLILRKRERRRRSISLPKLDSPWVELISFACFTAAVVVWHQHRAEIEATFRELFP